MKLSSRKKYIAFIATAAAFDIILGLCLKRGVELPFRNPITKDWMIDQRALNPSEWRDLVLDKKWVILGLTWFFDTGSGTRTLPADWSPGANTIYAIGSGAAGGAGGIITCLCGFSGSGGNGGGGGAFAQENNFGGTPGSVWNIQVGAGDTIFDSSGVLLAKAGSGSTGGQASSCVANGNKFSGGNGASGGFGTGAAGGGGGGGGGGSAGLNGGGQSGGNGNGGSCVCPPSEGGPGGTGNNGTIGGGGRGIGGGGGGGVGGNGLELDGIAGAAGGGGGGAGGDHPTFSNPGANNNGGPGGRGGFYGGGGGGGGGAGWNLNFCGGGAGGAAGAGVQGLLGYSYQSAGGYVFTQILG